jgi:hypothetical protein
VTREPSCRQRRRGRGPAGRPGRARCVQKEQIRPSKLFDEVIQQALAFACDLALNAGLHAALRRAGKELWRLPPEQRAVALLGGELGKPLWHWVEYIPTVPQDYEQRVVEAVCQVVGADKEALTQWVKFVQRDWY